MKRLIIRAKPSASDDAVIEISETEYIVSTTQPPLQGRANRAIIQLLADHLGVAASQVNIVSGRTSRTKGIVIHGF